MAERRRCQSDRRVLGYARGVPRHAPAAAAGWPHHQQRLNFRSCAEATIGAYTATKHAITGLTKSTALDGRPYDITCGQIDIGNAATDLTVETAQGVMQADGSIRAEPRMAWRMWRRAVVYMASLPLDSNVATITVMATKMPFVGRG